MHSSHFELHIASSLNPVDILYLPSTSVTAWCPVQALHRWGVWPFLHSSISPLLHPPRKYLLTFYTAAAALHLCRCRHRVWFPATATSHSSLAVSFSQPESLHLNWRGWHPDLEVGREMLRCLNPDQNKQLSLTHGYEWGLIFGSQHRIRVSSTTSGAGPGFRATTDEFVGDEAWEAFLEIQQSFAQDLQWETLNLIIG